MPNYERYATRDIVEMVDAVLARRGDEIEQWMKDNHPWQNRTGLAEANLSVAMVRDGLRISLILYHPWTTVEHRPGGDKFYPVYLERYMAGGAWGVLQDALDYWSPVLVEDIRKALGGT